MYPLGELFTDQPDTPSSKSSSLMTDASITLVCATKIRNFHCHGAAPQCQGALGSHNIKYLNIKEKEPFKDAITFAIKFFLIHIYSVYNTLQPQLFHTTSAVAIWLSPACQQP